MADILNSLLSGGASSILNTVGGIIGNEIEFGHQKELMEMQNEYNDPSAQLARLKKAGINPNTAASEIASQNTSASPSPVPHNAALENVGNSFAQGAALPSQISQNEAQAFKASEEGKTVAEMAYCQMLEIKSKIDVNDATARSINAEAKWIYKNNLAKLNLTNAQITETQELVNVHKEQINLMKDQARAARAAGNLDEALALTQQYITEQQKFRSDLIEKYGWDPYAATDNALLQCILVGDWDSYNGFMDYMFDKSYQSEEASYEFETTFADEEFERDAARLANEIAKQWNIPSASFPGLLEQICNFHGDVYGRTNSSEVRHIKYDVPGREYHKPSGRKGGKNKD